jgi:hypothetical protein
MKLFAIAVLLLILAGLAWVRLAPSEPTRWHVDPVAAPDPGEGGVRLVPDDAGGGAPVYELPPEALIAAFDGFVADQPRVTRLAGSVDEGRITYIARTKWIGFPDYVTVEALPLGADRSTLAILSRLRFGQSDLGVNRARVTAWLEAFDPLEE